MVANVRKLVGTVALVAFICVYALAAMVVGAAKFTDSSTLAQLVYYTIAGIIWIVPAAALISWMTKSKSGKT